MNCNQQFNKKNEKLFSKRVHTELKEVTQFCVCVCLNTCASMHILICKCMYIGPGDKAKATITSITKNISTHILLHVYRHFNS